MVFDFYNGEKWTSPRSNRSMIGPYLYFPAQIKQLEVSSLVKICFILVDLGSYLPRSGTHQAYCTTKLQPMDLGSSRHRKLSHTLSASIRTFPPNWNSAIVSQTYSTLGGLLVKQSNATAGISSSYMYSQGRCSTNRFFQILGKLHDLEVSEQQDNAFSG